MATVGVEGGRTEIQLTARDFRGQVNPDWCPGCGDFGVLNSLQRACAELGLQPHEILTVSGIGCSSNLPGYFNSYGMHTLHGRCLGGGHRGQAGQPRPDGVRHGRRRRRVRYRQETTSRTPPGATSMSPTS